MYALLVPCYNAAPYIQSFLENLKKLTIAFDEVIFYDDASTDNTLKLLEATGFKVISSKINRGPGYSRNRLAESAVSGLIHFHDIDDEFNPFFLEFIKEKAAIEPADVYVGNADWIDSLSRETILEWRYVEYDLLKDPANYLLTNPLGIINTVYSRDVFLRLNGFNEEIMCWEDADLHIRLSANGAKFSLINQVLSYSLRHSNGISRNQDWCWACRLKYLEHYLQKYKEILNADVLAQEIKKVSTAFIRTHNYSKLNEVIELNDRYGLSIITWKLTIIFYADKILPSFIIAEILKRMAK